MKTSVSISIDGRTYFVYTSRSRIEIDTDGFTVIAEGVELVINGTYYDADWTEYGTGKRHHFTTDFGSVITYFCDDQSVLECFGAEGNCFFRCFVQFPADIRGLTTITLSGTVRPTEHSTGGATC